MVESNHPFAQCAVSDFTVDDKTYKMFNMSALNDARYEKLPFAIRVLLESAVRNCDNFNIKRKSHTTHIPILLTLLLTLLIYLSSC